jgi:hypothetical protein
VKLTIEIRDEDAALVHQLCELTKDTTFNSHGPLTLESLAGMLLEDVALAVRRPGSWEGANMRQVLRSHGYSV